MNLFEFSLFGFEIKASLYGLMYALSFFIGYIILLKRNYLSSENLDNLMMYIFAGVILGGRFGYVVFYNLDYYLHNLGDIVKVWEGGMSFHGGALGVIIALYIFSKNYRINLYKLGDEICSIVPIGLLLGRLGNYFNKELLGFAGYNGPLAVEKNGIYYFPSPLLEAFLEGLILFLILFYINKNKKFNGQVASLFLIGYGVFRLFVEIFFREPDAHIGLIFGFLSMGEILSIPMILAGFILYYICNKK